MKNYFKKLSRSTLAAAFCGSMLLTNVAGAEPSANDLAAFKEAVVTPSQPDQRVFREQVIFFMPTFKANLDMQAASQSKDAVRIAGTLDFVITESSGVTTPMTIPFYLEQEKKDMTLYYKSDKKWKKAAAPALSAVAVNAAATPSQEELEQELALTKDVTVLRESDTQRTMQVTMDGNKIADMIAQSLAEKASKEKKDEADKAIEKQVFQYIEQGFRDGDITYTWTIDKQDWQTITLAVNLTAPVQSIAKSVLADESLPLPKDFRDLLESIAYYSEFKAYTSFLDPKGAIIEIPKEARNAETEEPAFTLSVDVKSESK